MSTPFKFTIITLFPDALRPYLETSMLKKASEQGIAEFSLINLRDFGLGPHRSVDDTPYGGGDGMLLRCEPAFAAIESITKTDPTAKVILPTPVGMLWNQNLARAFANAGPQTMSLKNLTVSITKTAPEQKPNKNRTKTEQTFQSASINSTNTRTKLSANPNSRHLIILCPHYEGYDERILTIINYPISLGKFVLTGGELPALVIIDSIVRLLPGTLGGDTSATIESFADSKLSIGEFPQYTKPAAFRNLAVPEILLSGDHAKIAAWRQQHLKKPNQ